MELFVFIGRVIYLWTSQTLQSYAIGWKKRIKNGIKNVSE